MVTDNNRPLQAARVKVVVQVARVIVKCNRGSNRTSHKSSCEGRCGSNCKSRKSSGGFYKWSIVVFRMAMLLAFTCNKLPRRIVLCKSTATKFSWPCISCTKLTPASHLPANSCKNFSLSHVAFKQNTSRKILSWNAWLGRMFASQLRVRKQPQSTTEEDTSQQCNHQQPIKLLHVHKKQHPRQPATELAKTCMHTHVQNAHNKHHNPTSPLEWQSKK